MLIHDPTARRNLAINLQVWLAEHRANATRLDTSAGLSSGQVGRLARAEGMAVQTATVHRLAAAMGWTVERLLAPPPPSPLTRDAERLIALSRLPITAAPTTPPLPWDGPLPRLPASPPSEDDIIAEMDALVESVAAADAQARAAVARALEAALAAVRT